MLFPLVSRGLTYLALFFFVAIFVETWYIPLLYASGIAAAITTLIIIAIHELTRPMLEDALDVRKRHADAKLDVTD